MLRQENIGSLHSSSRNGFVEMLGSLQKVTTPAFIYDETKIHQNLEWADILRNGSECNVLFAVKSFSFMDALRIMAPRLDGFGTSSLFEARLCRETSNSGLLHFTTPGIRPDELDEIAALCDYISFNSIGQWERYGRLLIDRIRCGLRVNPQLSFVDDERYDPCRKHSKLGIGVKDLAFMSSSHRVGLEGISGLLVHSNCDSTNFGELLDTVLQLQKHLGDLLYDIQWVNLGGGYIFDNLTDLQPFHKAIDILHSQYDIQIFIEPGAAFVRAAGYVISSVLDLFVSGDKIVAVLDTTVNHMPEVFEYGFQPDVVGHVDDGTHEYILAGCTCLAGDVFGEYRFIEPLEVGEQIIFCNAGAYTLSKAHTFNGINMPSIYSITPEKSLVSKKNFTYDEYAERWGKRVSTPI